MISLKTARKLKAKGLEWEPQVNDFFAIPDRDMNESIFVISDVQVTIDMLFGRQVVSFQGASEWALDSLVKDEAVWLPGEEQLREVLLELIIRAGKSGMHLISGIDGCHLYFEYQGRKYEFTARDASEAYAQGIIFLIEKQSTDSHFTS